jgi:hypothetical protein
LKRAILLAIILFICIPAHATNYFMAPAGSGGSDANNGTSSGTPWLTVNHALNCGDVITAAAGTYATSSFSSGNWGTVTCAANNNVAWVKCATFDACKISASGTFGMFLTKSYWGVQGFEITSTGSGAPCFGAQPQSSSFHHIIFANNIANGCQNSGFTTSSNGATKGIDYIAIIGNIAYNAAQTSAFCDSGITVYEPLASDTAPGTHIFIAGNFSYDNVDGTCNSGVPTDGEGIILDDWGGAQTGMVAYTQQGVVKNNITVLNGGRGIMQGGNGSPSAPVYVIGNTSYGNNTQASQTFSDCAEMTPAFQMLNSQWTQNLVMTSSATACTGRTNWAFLCDACTASNVIYANFAYSAAGNNFGIVNNNGFSYGTNASGTNPNFVSVADPGAPSCGSASSVPNCMATVIANFTPTTAAAKAYGYQVPSTTSVYDPLYPQWLCTVTNLPTGLVTPGCVTGSSVSGATLGAGASIH